MNILRHLFVISWTALMITSSLVALMLTFNRRIPITMARTMWAPGILWACSIKLRIQGTEMINPANPYIFVANHLSALDIPVLFRAIPVNLHFIAKKEVMWMPFIGWYMWATGMIFIDRSNKEKAVVSLEKAGKLIKNGKHVIMFPEGTRSKNHSVATFKKGPFVLSSQAGVEIAPVAISGTERVVPAWSWFSLNRPTEVVVNIGATMGNMENLDMATYAAKAREAVVRMKV